MYPIMTKVLLSILITFLISISLKGQYTFKHHYFQRNKEISGAKHALEITGAYELGSDFMANAFASKFYQGGFIDNDLKTSTQSRLQNSNTIGLEIQAGLEYKLALDSMNLVFSVGQKLQSNNTFSKNLYNLYLFGNQPYAGESLSLATTRAHVQSYRYYAVGLEKQFDDLMLGGKVKLYQGRYFYDVQLERGNFFTAEDGSQITFNPDLELNYMTSPDKFNPGLGIDFFVLKRHKKSMAFIEINDLGFINYQNSSTIKVDSSYNFKGVHVENILDVTEQDFDFSRDSIENVFGVGKETGTLTRMTPARFTIGFQQVVSEKFLLEAFINYRLLPSYAPQIIMKPNFFILDNLSIAPVITLGGFDKVNMGLNVSYHTPKFYAIIDVLEFENLIAPNKTSGRGSFIKTGFIF